MFSKRLLIALLLLFPNTVFAADSTVASLTAASALGGTELFYCIQAGDKKCTSAQIGTYILNGLTITSTTGTLSITNLKTATFTNSITIAGTDNSTLNIGAGGTLGSNAFTSTAYAPLASPTFTGTVTIPSPFTLGAISVTSTGTQLNLLNAAAGTTGTTSTNVVFSTSPVLVTPNLGTPSTLVLTNATGTPSSIGLANGTGLPIAGIASLGAGVGTWLATPSSANLAAVITDETGSGVLVFGTSPTIAAPVINGLPTGTAIANTNTASTLVARDSSGNFAAGTITATLSGAATSATTATNATNTAITEDTATNASMFPTWVTANTGNLPQKTTSTKLTFNPSTGVLSSTSFTGAGTGLTGTAASLTAGTVTTNANLTGVITSSGNTTSIASQTGTGSKFVVDTSPTISNPTITTALTYGGVTLSNAVTGTGNMVLSASSSLTGVVSITTLNISNVLQINGCTASSSICAAGLTTSAGTNPLCWNSSTFQITSAVACTASDERLKTNFGKAPGLEAIMCLDGISFDWLDTDQAKRNGRQIGFTAQAVQKCVPEAVSNNGSTTITLDDGTQKTIDNVLVVDYGRLTAVLVNAIKELRR